MSAHQESHAAPAPLPAALLGLGTVRHRRARPAVNAFTYRTWFVMLPMRTLRTHPAQAGALPRNRRARVAFHDADHGTGGPDALAWADGVLHDAGITDATGELWLHTYPRVWNQVFKPVSFWYAHRTDGSLRAVLAEVNNTFGERHVYLLDQPRYGHPCHAAKVFHVSPFCPVQGHYAFTFMRTTQPARTVARIDYFDVADAPALLVTSVQGTLQLLDDTALTQARRHAPWLGVGVVTRIHLQALRLWWRSTPFYRKPAPPAVTTSPP